MNLQDLDTGSLFFALLTVLGNVFLVAVAATAVLVRVRGVTPQWVAVAREAIAGAALPLAWGVALVTTSGSLVLSEYYNLPPCILCWYQRIAMYPLVVILGVAVLRRDPGVRRYAIPLAGVGAAISVYHYVHERFPDSVSTSCSVEVPCSIVWIWRFGYISIPFMAFTGFALVIVLLLLSGPPRPPSSAVPAAEETPSEPVHEVIP